MQSNPDKYDDQAEDLFRGIKSIGDKLVEAGWADRFYFDGDNYVFDFTPLGESKLGELGRIMAELPGGVIGRSEAWAILWLISIRC